MDIGGVAIFISTHLQFGEIGLGSLADWISAIGTIGAIVWGIIQMRKQADYQRAFTIENKRPYFSYERTDNIMKNEIVLRPNNGEGTSENIKERLNKDEGDLFRINNISDNAVYSLEIVLEYDDCQNNYIYDGLLKEQSMVLIPDNFFYEWKSIFIKFRTSAGEIGYLKGAKDTITSYYFVKNNNTAVSVYGDDKLISKNDELIKEFDAQFNPNKASRFYFKSKEDIIKTISNSTSKFEDPGEKIQKVNKASTGNKGSL